MSVSGKLDVSKTSHEDWLESFMEMFFEISESFARCCSVLLRAERDCQLVGTVPQGWCAQVRQARRRVTRVFMAAEDQLVDYFGEASVPVPDCMDLASSVLRETRAPAAQAIRRVAAVCRLLRGAGSEELRASITCAAEEFSSALQAVASALRTCPVGDARTASAVLRIEVSRSQLATVR